MDSRDIKEPVPFEEVLLGNGLQGIFNRQRKLLDSYTKIEKLPNYPIDIDIKENQILIKDFISRIIEELAESFESYKQVSALYGVNPLEVNKDTDLLPQLQNYSEEVADSLHFMVELLIYCNIDEASIDQYYYKLLQELNLQDAIYFMGDTLATITEYARYCNIQDGVYNNPDLRGFELLKGQELTNLSYQGGRKISPEITREHKCQLWDTTYHFNLARNFLKNKAWKQTEMMTDSGKFQMQVMEGFLHFFKYVDFAGFDIHGIFEVYFKKNQVNLFRINSKY